MLQRQRPSYVVAFDEFAMELQLKSHLALLVIDMQNGFCHVEGTFAKLGRPVSSHMAIVPAIHHLESIAHAHKMPIFYTRMGFDEHYSDCGILLDRMPAIKELNGFVRGTWDAEIIDELVPKSTESEVIIIDKIRNSAFWHTDLAKQLSERGINQLIATGVGTNVCVECTVRDAYTEGFYVVTCSDATATLSKEEHEATLLNLKWFGGTATVEEIDKALSK